MENKENYFFESIYQALIHFFCLVHLPWNRWLGIISTNNSGIWAWNRWLGIISTIWVFCHPCWYLCAFLVYSKDNTFQWQLLCMYSARHFCFDLNSVWSKIGVNSNFLCLQMAILLCEDLFDEFLIGSREIYNVCPKKTPLFCFIQRVLSNQKWWSL